MFHLFQTPDISLHSAHFLSELIKQGLCEIKQHCLVFGSKNEELKGYSHTLTMSNSASFLKTEYASS